MAIEPTISTCILVFFIEAAADGRIALDDDQSPS
jgi:hypothetical protein